jgi:PIN domain nuclease of toxin-antitoxin system
VRLLLDSHTLLWWLDDSPTLSRDAYDAISEPENEVAVSAVTVWELEIKRASGKLKAPRQLLRRVEEEEFTPLAITLEHGVAAGELPPHHGDPFDRMLIAQARLERLIVVTRDPRFSPYAVKTMPA